MKPRIYLFIITIFSLALYWAGCADSVSGPGTAGGEVKITVNSPKAFDTISYKGTEIIYEIETSGSIKFIELHINGEYVSTFFPTISGGKPNIIISVDSGFVNSNIKYQLKYFDASGGFAETPVIENVYVAEIRNAPYTPFNFKITKISETSVNISWKDTSGSKTGFEIWRKIESATDFTYHLTAVPGTFNINDENLEMGKIYFYKVRGFNSYGYSPFTYVVNTLGSGGSLTIQSPKLLSAIALNTKVVSIVWEDRSNNENYFRIERKGNFGDFQSIGIIARNFTSYVDSGTVMPGNEYYYRIKAYSGSDSSWSNELFVRVPYYILVPPTLLSLLNPSTNKVVLEWRDNDAYYANWSIERKTGSSGSFIQIAEVDGYLSLFEDFSTEPNQTYTYKVRSFDATGYSEYSEELSITTTVVPLLVPAGITVKYLAYYAVEVKWTTIDPNALNVLIERRLYSEPSSAFTQIGILDKYQKVYWDVATQCQKTYVYRVRVTDGVYFSSYSPEFTVMNTDLCP